MNFERPGAAERLTFGSFSIDLGAASLRRGEQDLGLRPKTWEVLRHLIERAGQLVTKDELIARVWAGLSVTDGTLTQSIRELRAALGDDSKQPRFIATVHRRGYRFIAKLDAPDLPDDRPTGELAPEPQATPLLVGRERELAQIHDALDAAVVGRRGCVFVSGEPGIGKTTLIDEFLRGAAQRYGGRLRIARGQCVEQRREAEPYLAVLEALDQLCRGRDGAEVIDGLRRFAPSWLMQLPWVLPPDELEALQRQLMGASSERMLRELITAIEELAHQTPLLLVLEDVHWSDPATIDLLAALARRRTAAAILIVASTRSAGTGAQQAITDLRLTLASRGEATEVRLSVLDADSVRAYIGARLGDQAPAALVTAIERHSGGNPLFLSTAVNYALNQGWLVERDGRWQLTLTPAEVEGAIPIGLRQLIEAQVLHLDPDDRTVLEAASVAGVEFGVRTLAVAMGRPVTEVGESLGRMSRRGRFVRHVAGSGERSDAPRFQFAHALYHQVLYEGMPTPVRRAMHLAVARGLELEAGERAGDVAAELAVHFERGGAFQEAARYLGLAALNAHARGADRESAALLESALNLIGQVEDSPRRKRSEADLCIQLGAVTGSIYGRGAERYMVPFQRAWELAQELDDVPRMFLARMAAFGHFGLTEQLRQAEVVCQDLLALAARVPMPDIVAVAHGAMGSVLFGMGELHEARRYLETALATLNPHDPSTQLYRRLEDPEILCLTGLAWTIAQLGYPDAARRRAAEVIEIGAARAPYHHVYCLNAAAIVDLFLDDPEGCLAHAEQTLEIARERGFDGFLGNASVLACWARERREPRPGAWQRLRDEVESYRRCTQRFGLAAYQALVAEACLAEGAIAEGLAVIAAAEAMMESSGEITPRGTVLRVKAMLLARSSAAAGEVEACFGAAIAAAQRSGAKLAELRAATALAEWRRDRGDAARARAILEPIHGWFTEGHDTVALQNAAALLGTLR